MKKVGLTSKYNEIAGRAAGFGLVKKEDANIQEYGTSSAVLKKVFGAMK